jgi:hypothetical protein
MRAELIALAGATYAYAVWSSKRKAAADAALRKATRKAQKKARREAKKKALRDVKLLLIGWGSAGQAFGDMLVDKDAVLREFGLNVKVSGGDYGDDRCGAAAVVVVVVSVAVCAPLTMCLSSRPQF